MNFDVARFEALSLARRSAVLALERHAAGTSCASWFPRMRAPHLATTLQGMQGNFYWPGTSAPNPADSWQIEPNAPARPTDPKDLNNPTKSERNVNDFATWMRGGPAPAGSSAKMNCWEVVMYAAFVAGLVTEARLRQIHADAATAASGSSSGADYYRVLYAALGGPGSPLAAAASPERGDLIFFNFPAHVALSLGSRSASGEREVMSLWILPPDPTGTRFVNNLQRTTIEALLRAMNGIGMPPPTVRRAPNPF
jgi:cell wall-associated NlpC family hydrolase